MWYKKKAVILLTITISLSMLAVAGKIIVDKRRAAVPVEAPALPSVSEEYARLMQKMLSPAGVMQMEGNIELYDGASPNLVKEKSSFTYLRSRGGFYTRMSYQQTWFNGQFLVQVDSVHRMVFITPVDEKNKGEMSFSDPVAMANKMFSDTASFRAHGVVTGDDLLRSITVSSDYNPEIQSFTVWYSPKDYTMRNSEVRFYKNGRRTESDMPGKEDVWITRITYRQVQAQDTDIDGMIARIFTTKKHTIEPTDAYKDYKVILK